MVYQVIIGLMTLQIRCFLIQYYRKKLQPDVVQHGIILYFLNYQYINQVLHTTECNIFHRLALEPSTTHYRTRELLVNTADLKEKLYDHCLAYVNSHIETNSTAFENTQDAARSETKTVASEEPETGKERMQREMETIGQRLEEALKERKILQSIDYKKTHTTVEPGALVETSIGVFFISLSADEIEIDGEEYCPTSLASPIGQALEGKKAGETASFRERAIAVNGVC